MLHLQGKEKLLECIFTFVRVVLNQLLLALVGLYRHPFEFFEELQIDQGIKSSTMPLVKLLLFGLLLIEKDLFAWG